MTNELLEPLLQIGFSHYEGRFASGQKANNKLELDYKTLSNYPAILGKVVLNLCKLIEPYDVDFVVGVPNGADGFANDVAKEMDLYRPYLTKDENTGLIDYATEIDKENVVKHLKAGALIKDVINLGTSTRKVLALEGMDPKIKVIAAVFNRANPSWRKHNPISQPILALASKPIKPKLSRYSRLWRYASPNKFI